MIESNGCVRLSYWSTLWLRQTLYLSKPHSLHCQKKAYFYCIWWLKIKQGNKILCLKPKYAGRQEAGIWCNRGTPAIETKNVFKSPFLSATPKLWLWQLPCLSLYDEMGANLGWQMYLLWREWEPLISGFTWDKVSPEAERQTAVKTAGAISPSRERWGSSEERPPCLWPLAPS